jgi:hypothetical protein
MTDVAVTTRAVFQDPTHEAAFATDGFVVVDVLDDAQVREVREIFDRLCPDPSAQFLASMAWPDRAYPTAVDREVRPIVAPGVLAHLVGYRDVFGSYVSKGRGDENTVDLHQDWNFVDEDRFRSVLAWVPLIDTDETNGTLAVVPGTHRAVETLRGSPDIPTPYVDEHDLIRERFLQPVPLRAGQAILYDGALLHGSSPNRTSDVRPAFGLVSVPEEAELLHWFIEDGQIDLYEVDARFFTEVPFMTRPEGYRHLGPVDHTTVPLSADEVAAVLHRPKPTWRRRLAALWGRRRPNPGR